MNSFASKPSFAACVLLVHLFFLPPAASAKTQSTVISTPSSAIDFGSFAVLPSCAGCTITISPAGVRTASPGIVLTSANPGSAATYTVTAVCNGASCSPYSAAVTPSSAALPAGAVTMTVSAFTTAQSATNPPNVLSVGATLTIPSTVAAGTYSGAAFLLTTTP